MKLRDSWDFTDDRGHLAEAATRPARVVAYVQAGATLWDHGLTPLGIFGSHHDGDSADPVKAGELPLSEVLFFGAGSTLDPDALLAAGPDLLVAVSYGGGQLYGIDPETAKHLEEHVPVVVLDVGRGQSLGGIRDRFTALARSLRAPDSPRTPGGAVLGEFERARAALRAVAARPNRPRVLALSAAGPETAYLARPMTWPDLRALTELGVDVLDPGEGSGGNWHTGGWSEAAALEPDIVLTDVRSNAASRDQLRHVPAWCALEERARVLPWNPEAPHSHRAHGALFGAVAEAL